MMTSRILACYQTRKTPDFAPTRQFAMDRLKQSPSEWMPWNYRETLARLARRPLRNMMIPSWPKRIVCGPANRASHNAVKRPSRKAKPDDVFRQRQKVETAAGRRG
jgi:hypothetical protein